MSKRMSNEERRAMFARLHKGKVSPKRAKPVDIFEYHKLKIAKKTLLMPDEILGVIGGMTKVEAQAIVDKNRRRRGVSPLAKTRVWKKDGNHMVFDSPHKGFNKQVDGISTGNVMGDVQLSGFVRPYNETECNGFTPLGQTRRAKEF